MAQADLVQRLETRRVPAPGSDVTAGIAITTRAPTTTTGFARSAPSTSRWPMRTAAVVPPQNGQGMPVIARNGHRVAGLPGTLRFASATAATPAAATR